MKPKDIAVLMTLAAVIGVVGGMVVEHKFSGESVFGAILILLIVGAMLSDD